MTNNANYSEEGLATRSAMFGEEATAAQTKGDDPLTDKLQQLVTNNCFADIWNREGLGLKERSMVTIGILAAMGRPQELKIHIRGALSNGVTPTEVREIMLHSYLYAGLPSAVSGIHAAADVFTDEERSEIR